MVVSSLIPISKKAVQADAGKGKPALLLLRADAEITPKKGTAMKACPIANT